MIAIMLVIFGAHFTSFLILNALELLTAVAKDRRWSCLKEAFHMYSTREKARPLDGSGALKFGFWPTEGFQSGCNLAF